MAEGEHFKATIICQTNLETAIVFDFGYADVTAGAGHVDTGIAAGDFQTLVQAKLAALLPTPVAIMKYRFACVLGTHIGEIGFVEGDPIIVGLNEPDYILPSEVCISVKRNTGYASRRDRGRVFFGPVGSNLRDPDNTDKVKTTDADLVNFRNLLKTNLVTQTRTLEPVILAADGTHSGHKIVNVAIAEVFVHRKSRRLRVGA